MYNPEGQALWAVLCEDPDELHRILHSMTSEQTISLAAAAHTLHLRATAVWREKEGIGRVKSTDLFCGSCGCSLGEMHKPGCTEWRSL